MKVWNREVKECNDCGFCEYIVDIDGKTAFRCKETGYLVRHDSIDDQCPFNKPITNKMIESFGFKKENILESDSDEFIEGYTLNLDKKNKILFYIKDKVIYIYKSCEYDNTSGNWAQIDLFRGYLNNPEELKFILKKLKIIK